jgi:hypothetical protein
MLLIIVDHAILIQKQCLYKIVMRLPVVELVVVDVLVLVLVDVLEVVLVV